MKKRDAPLWETVPLDALSRWSGLSPWVVVLLRPMAGAASPTEGSRVRCRPRIKPGSSSVVNWA